MKPPPFLPEETLARVLRVSYFDGLSVLLVAVFFAALAATGGDFSGMVVGLAIAAAGAIELHGAFLLRAGDSRGMKWVLASQPYLALTILGYCLVRLTNYDPTLMRAAMTSDLRAQIAASGISEEHFLRLAYSLVYGVFAIVTIGYQGGMSIYYLRRRAAVASALDPEIG